MLKAPLHTCKPSNTTWFNRVFTLAYTLALFALFYRHCRNLILSPSLTTIYLFIADVTLALLWVTWQAFFLIPVTRHVFPENLPQVASESEYPRLDVFVCTCDPFREPLVGVVSTALSVMAYDYPTEKLSVYVSDDAGSQLTLFALGEAAKFAKHWLPYCKTYDVLDRSPQAYFASVHDVHPETDEIQAMYESMKTKIEKVVQQRAVSPDHIIGNRWIKAFNKWTPGSTNNHHATIIEVLLESSKDNDITGHVMPNLVYVSREKSKSVHHHFKAGALNVLIRVSAALTNAPIFLILDCDMYSNDPKTPLQTLCYFLDPNIDPKLAFIQYPQRFHDINKYDTYGAEHKLETQVCPRGMDGTVGTLFMGSCGFFRRRAVNGRPSSTHPSEFKQKKSQQQNKSIQYEGALTLAHSVASYSYEENTKWGSEMGFRYGSLVEDVYTSLRMQYEGWRSVFCNPKRAAFLGNSPMNLNDILSQSKRWYVGFLEMGFSKYSPLTYGLTSMNPLQALCYAHYNLRPFLSIPIIIYAFLPQLALVNSYPLFPKVSEPWFFLYAFLSFGAYGKDLLDNLLEGGMFQRWWNHQRMWLILGCSSYPFAVFDWLLKSFGMSTIEFNVTSKVVNDNVSKRYEEGVVEFGVENPMFLTLSIPAMVNLLAFVYGMIQVLKNGIFEEMFVQIFIAGFAVMNSWPIYEAMVMRSDKGKMPTSIAVKAIGVALVICSISSLAFKKNTISSSLSQS